MPVDPDPLAEWIRAARSNDEHALDRLWSHFEPVVSRYVRGRLHPSTRRWADVDGLVQRALEEVLGAPHELPEEVDGTVLLRRLRRAALTRIYDVARKHRREVGESAVAPEARAARPSAGPVTRADERRWVRELVERLPPPYAEVVRLCALEELTFVEAGRRTGLPPDTLRKRYHKARRLIAESVDRTHGR